MHGELYKSYNEEGEEIEPNMSIKDSLKKALQDLKELYDDNLISEEIYKERQKELLKKIGD